MLLMDKKLIALDIDGTIAEHNGTVAPETVEAINAVVAFGHHVILASGRSYFDMVPVLEHVGINSKWLVATNGAVTFKNTAEHIYDSKYVEVNVLEILPDEHVKHFQNIAPHANMMIEVHGEGFYYDGVFDIPYTEGVEKRKVNLEDLYGKKSLRFIVTDHIDNEEFWYEQVKLYGQGLIGSYDGTENVWVEILHKQANKADALEAIRKQINIPLHDVMAFGDGHNDIRMLEWAGKHGKSFAMGQAHADVKSAASHETDTVENLGVAKILNTLL